MVTQSSRSFQTFDTQALATKQAGKHGPRPFPSSTLRKMDLKMSTGSLDCLSCSMCSFSTGLCSCVCLSPCALIMSEWLLLTAACIFSIRRLNYVTQYRISFAFKLAIMVCSVMLTRQNLTGRYYRSGSPFYSTTYVPECFVYHSSTLAVASARN